MTDVFKLFQTNYRNLPAKITASRCLSSQRQCWLFCMCSATPYLPHEEDGSGGYHLIVNPGDPKKYAARPSEWPNVLAFLTFDVPW